MIIHGLSRSFSLEARQETKPWRPDEHIPTVIRAMSIMIRLPEMVASCKLHA